MAHFDPALMRIVLRTSGLFPEDVLLDDSNPLRRNLEGRFDRESFSTRLSHREFHRATVVAHEQRHYLDYHLTNYGSWISRFWGQAKQSIPALFYSERPLIVPIQFMEDDALTAFYGTSPPVERTAEWMGVRLAANHARRVALDQVSLPGVKHGFSGTVQLEALATTFQIGPMESLLSVEECFEVGVSLPRDMKRWQDEYVWLGDTLAALELGPAPLALDDQAQIVNSRIWPSILVAALMGRFDLLTAENMKDDPSLWHRIMPSSRLADILMWLHTHARRKLNVPSDAWEAVNDACLDLYGENVISSMVADVEWMRLRMEEHLKRQNPYLVTDLLAHLSTRMATAVQFATDPYPFIDPISAWTESDLATPLKPDFHFASVSGFSRSSRDLVSFTSDFFSGFEKTHFLKPRPQPSADLVGLVDDSFNADIVTLLRRPDNPEFVNPTTADVLALMQREDEDSSAILRFLVRGAASPSWIGPERDSVRQWIASNSKMHIVPPYGETPE